MKNSWETDYITGHLWLAPNPAASSPLSNSINFPIVDIVVEIGLMKYYMYTGSSHKAFRQLTD